MVLPLLMSIGLPALAGSGAFAGIPFLAGMSAPALAGMGAGLGSFIQTGDIGDGIKTGLTSFLGGKVLSGITGGGGLKDTTAMTGAQQAAQGSIEGSKFLSALPTGTEGSLFSGGIQGAAAGAMLPGVMPAAFMGQAMTDAQMMEQQAKNRAAEDGDGSGRPPMPRPMQVSYNPDPFASGGGEGLYFQYQRPPAPQGYTPQYPYYYAEGGILDLANQRRAAVSMGGHPIFSSLGRQLQGAVSQHYGSKVEPFIKKVEQDARSEFGDDIFVAQNETPTAPDRPEMPIADLPTQLPTAVGAKGASGQPFKTPIREMFQETQVSGMAEGGEAEIDEVMEENGMNEKDVIVEAIKAVKGMKSEEEAKIILGIFLAKYGREQYLELIDSVQSGEYDDTVERFAMGEKGMVKGPGDGSGKDDMVPATLDGQQDVLLTEDEFVLRQPTTNALEKAFGGGFLDKINEAEKDAPEVLKRMVG